MFEMISDFNYFSDEFHRIPIELATDSTIDKEPTPTRLKILVVDDERLIADTVADILQRAGFDVASAYDGWAALEAVKRFRPDCLLSDVLMPQINGVELAIMIQKTHPNVKILLFSGQAGISEILLDGHRRGLTFEVIAKPIHPLKLIERLKNQE